jgi:hypothetical protein
LCTLAPGYLNAQTIVQGNIGGTWTPAGNPYIAIDNCTVTSTLILQPGVIFEIESNLTITANGNLIQAVGTPTQRITIQGFPSTNYFNYIEIANESGTNRFKYCDFANAQAGIVMMVAGGNQIMPVEIMNCTFSNCVQHGIYGHATGTAGGSASVPGYSYSETLNPVIENCVFYDTVNGCTIDISGTQVNIFGDIFTGYGYSYPIILNNVFQNLTGTAFLMQIGSYAGGGSSLFVNNTVSNCMGGVNATDPWNATAQSDIFVGCTNAVTVSGSLSRAISYNDFFSNATNFTGLPAAYGQVLLNNRNGTPSDVLYNIYQNPLFAVGTNLYLATNSPCVNAGPPGQAFDNMCSPPSIGTNYNDMGAYGGPDACNWLNVVPLVQVEPSSISTSNSLLWVDWFAVPRSTYQIQYATNLVNGSNNWQNLANGQAEALGTPTSISVAPYPLRFASPSRIAWDRLSPAS